MQGNMDSLHLKITLSGLHRTKEKKRTESWRKGEKREKKKRKKIKQQKKTTEENTKKRRKARLKRNKITDFPWLYSHVFNDNRVIQTHHLNKRKTKKRISKRRKEKDRKETK